MNDKEGRKWLLQKLYDRGFKYIFYVGGLGGYITTKQQPETLDNHTYVGGSFERIDVLSDLIPDFNEPNYLDIGKHLGIVDTTYGVRKRHFAEYKNNRVVYFNGGATSWSANIGMITDVKPSDVRLAGGNDEN